MYVFSCVVVPLCRVVKISVCAIPFFYLSLSSLCPRLDPSLYRDILLVDTQTNLLTYDSEDTRDIFCFASTFWSQNSSLASVLCTYSHVVQFLYAEWQQLSLPYNSSTPLCALTKFYVHHLTCIYMYSDFFMSSPVLYMYMYMYCTWILYIHVVFWPSFLVCVHYNP